MVNAIAVGPNLANKESACLQRCCSTVDRGGIHVRIAQRETQFGQVGHFVNLPAGRLEQDGGAYATVNVAKRACGICIQRSGMRHRPGEVGVDGRVEPRFP